MNKKILKKLSSLYDDIYSPIPYHQNKTKMVSFVIYKNKILCFGVNSERTSPIQHYYRIRTKDTNKDYISLMNENMDNLKLIVLVNYHAVSMISKKQNWLLCPK